MIISGMRWLIYLFLVSGITYALAQSFTPRALDHTAVTVSGTAVTALIGPANGCNISSAVDLIIDPVTTAVTSASGTAQKQATGGAPYQCGPLGVGVQISVNCSGGGTCSWSGTRW